MTAHADIQTTNRNASATARNKERIRERENAHIQHVVQQLLNICKEIACVDEGEDLWERCVS
jgi:hypothetical protein